MSKQKNKLSTYFKCPTCQTWGWTHEHRCQPAWKVANEYGEEEGLAYGADAEEAARHFAERYDWENEDLLEIAVHAVAPERDGFERRWIHVQIRMSFEPVYAITPSSNAPEQWEAPR